MDILTVCAGSTAAEIGKCTAKPIKRHIGYLFCFKKIVGDLTEAKVGLEKKKQAMQDTIEEAVKNTEVVENDVQEWLTNVTQFIEEVQTLENQIQIDKMCCKGCCPDWIWRYKLGKQATQKATTAVKLLQDARDFKQLTHRAPTPSIEIFSSNGDCEVFESRKLIFEELMEALRDDNCKRIGVHGLGGVGKTTLVMDVCKKAKDLFSDIVMTTVSQTPDIRKIQGEIADCLDLKLGEESDSGRAKRICSDHFFWEDNRTKCFDLRVLVIKELNFFSMNAFKVLFRTVEYIQIESCEMECIVDTTSRGDHTVMFANLIKLHLMYMSCLRTICEGPNHYVIFSNLTDFVADGCTRLVSLFSPSVAQSLKKLKNLRLVHCNELKQIISEDEGMILESHSQPICLPELQTIYVKYCPKLEYIFPLLVARDLPQLESLELEDLPQLKQVFDHEKEGDVRDGNNASVWPSLKEVKVENCPKMKWSFFADLEANVPAHGKVPRVDEEDEPTGFSTNSSVVTLWPPNKDEGDTDNDDFEWDDADLMGRR
ncbi:disease resistance protein [Fagus crenata]